MKFGDRYAIYYVLAMLDLFFYQFKGYISVSTSYGISIII